MNIGNTQPLPTRREAKTNKNNKYPQNTRDETQPITQQVITCILHHVGGKFLIGHWSSQASCVTWVENS